MTTESGARCLSDLAREAHVLAVAAGSRSVTSTHLLAALLDRRDPEVQRALARLHIAPEPLRQAALATLKSAPASSPVPAREYARSLRAAILEAAFVPALPRPIHALLGILKPQRRLGGLLPSRLTPAARLCAGVGLVYINLHNAASKNPFHATPHDAGVA